MRVPVSFSAPVSLGLFVSVAFIFGKGASSSYYTPVEGGVEQVSLFSVGLPYFFEVFPGYVLFWQWRGGASVAQDTPIRRASHLWIRVSGNV